MLPNPEIFGITLNWYTFIPKIGILLTLVFAIWHYKNQTDFKISALQFVGVIVMLYVVMIGAGRVVGYFEDYLREGEFPHYSFFFKDHTYGKFRWSGSLLGVLILLPFLAKRILRIRNTQAFFDLLVLSFCLFTAIIKQACQFAGDGCYGIPTNLPWGMYYPYGQLPNILPVHPTPIYDSLFHLGLFIWLLRFDLKKKKSPGKTTPNLLYRRPRFLHFPGINQN